MQLRDFIAQTKLDAKLPFDIDTEISKGDFTGYPTIKIGSLEIPRLDDLTHAEAFLFEAIGGVNENKLVEIRSEMLQLAASLQAKFPQLTVIEAYNLIFNPSDLLDQTNAQVAKVEEALQDKTLKPAEKVKLEKEQKHLQRYNLVLESSEYSDWLVLITDRLTKITDLSKSRESDINVDWLQITFFLMSRLGDWDMAKTGTLTRKQIRQIKEFMLLESNEGQPINREIETTKLETQADAKN